jgi:hypothetical protein
MQLWLRHRRANIPEAKVVERLLQENASLKNENIHLRDQVALLTARVATGGAAAPRLATTTTTKIQHARGTPPVRQISRVRPPLVVVLATSLVHFP